MSPGGEVWCKGLLAWMEDHCEMEKTSQCPSIKEAIEEKPRCDSGQGGDGQAAREHQVHWISQARAAMELLGN